MNLNDFIKAVADLNINLSLAQLDALKKYYELLISYNKVMNLTGITEENEVYLKHFYDSLTISKVIDLNKVESLCDMGSGAGFPGIVLKIAFPNIKITLLDSLQKRINFLNIVIKELNLQDIEAIHCRIEEYALNNREKFEVVTARAVASTNILLEYASALIKVNGYFIALKGKMDNEHNYDKALNILGMEVEKEEKFLLPIEQSSRTILKVKKRKVTDKKYPRSFKEIKNKPL